MPEAAGRGLRLGSVIELPQRHAFDLFADYFQFYIEDEAAEVSPEEAGDAWTEEAGRNLLAPARGSVRIGTARNTTVPVELRVEAEEPATEFQGYDHVAEASIDVPSGRLVIAGNSDYWPDAARIELAPGSYRVRVLYRGLATVSEDGLGGDDSYALVLWPAPPAPTGVLKRYERP